MNDPVESEGRADIKRLGLLLGQQYEADTETEGRLDLECFCPRINTQILIIGHDCYYRERGWECWGCVFNHNFPLVKLTILLAELIERRDLKT
jgi:hypothetical protein